MEISYNQKNIRLPDFLVVGAVKSGTTSLHYYFKQHPGIFMPSIKELRFFGLMGSDPRDVPAWLKGRDGVFLLEDYVKFFESAGTDQLIGESCPTYLYAHQNTIRNLKTLYGKKLDDLKIIMILRSPAEGVWSHFMMRRKNGVESCQTIREYLDSVAGNRWPKDSVDYIGFGKYYHQVKAFLDTFSKVKVILYDELCENGHAAIKDLFRFLGVDDDATLNLETKYNVSGEARAQFALDVVTKNSPFKRVLRSLLPRELRTWLRFRYEEKIIERREIPDDLKKELVEDHFEKDIIALERLLGKDLGAWRTVVRGQGI